MNYKDLKNILFDNSLQSIEAEGVYDLTQNKTVFDKIFLTLSNGKVYSFEMMQPHFKDDAQIIFEQAIIEKDMICYSKTINSRIKAINVFLFKKRFFKGNFFQLELILESGMIVSLGYIYYTNEMYEPISTGEIAIFYNNTIEYNKSVMYQKITF